MLGITVIVVDDDLRERLHPRGHRPRKAMDRRGFRAQRRKLLRIVIGDLVHVEAADAVSDLLRPGEGVFHRVLLIKHHPDQKRERIGLQQRVGRGILN
jgi:hypothetical protein